jgi:transcriptional regulator with XRE-family HTH domain
VSRAQESTFEDFLGQRSGQSIEGILKDLRASGLSTDSIAGVVGVSRQALHKWVTGESRPTDERRDRIVRLAAICDYVERRGLDPAAWLKDPLGVKGPPITRLDFAQVGRFDLLGQMLDGSIAAGDAVTAGFPSRPVPSVEVVSSVVGDEVLVELPKLGAFGHGRTLSEAQADLIAVVRSVAGSFDSDDPEASLLRSVLHDEDALHRVLFGW